MCCWCDGWTQDCTTSMKMVQFAVEKWAYHMKKAVIYSQALRYRRIIDD